MVDRYHRLSRLDSSMRLRDFLMELFAARTRRQLAARLAGKTAQIVMTQTAVRVAPGLVRPCVDCGRIRVRLRAGGLSLCARCRTARSDAG
ncbi:MAG: hypothetical protein ACRDL7_11825, partial [Gaiellaceae bacterium]